MAISSNLKVTSDVDGEYTLVELLDLLGSPTKVKTALAELEKSARADTKAYKTLVAAEAKRQTDVLIENAEREKDLVVLAKGQAELQAGQEKLLEDTAASNTDINNARNGLREKEAAFAKLQDNSAAGLREVKKERAALVKERESMMIAVAAEQELADHDRAIANKLKADAKKIMADANAKIANMKKVLG